MKGIITIQNTSHSIPIIISLESIDKIHVHVFNLTILPTSSYSIIAKGGVKILKVSKDDGSIFWIGSIPSFGNHPIIISPEKAQVKYNSLPLVNTYTNTKKYVYIACLILALIILILLTTYYIKK